MVKPLKALFPEFSRMEQAVMAVIGQRFGATGFDARRSSVPWHTGESRFLEALPRTRRQPAAPAASAATKHPKWHW